MLYYEEFLNFDPSSKTPQWANQLVTRFREHWVPLINARDAEDNMRLVLSRYDMKDVEGMFKDPKKIKMEFLPLAIFEKVRNILIGESEHAGISVDVNAIDPMSEGQRKQDRKLLENRAEIESLLTYLNQSIGLPEYKLSQDPEFKSNGNIEAFDDMGLNSQDPSHLGHFMKTWYRLQHEIDAQNLVNYDIKVNELEQHIPDWINDILGKKAIAMQCYVNEMTGKYEMRYLKPEYVLHIPGVRKDGNDDVCKGYEDVITVSELIKRMGNDFDLEKNILHIIHAVNYRTSRQITGVYDSVTERVYGTGDKQTVEVVPCVADFLNFHVQIGYIEWKSWDCTTSKVGENYHGNYRRYNRSYSYEPTEDTGYKKEAKYHQTTYKSFYLCTSGTTQILYKFGKLYHQVIEGAEDEYSSYSIFHQIKEGPTAAEVAKPWIRLAQETFTKMRWMVRAAKPKGRTYNYDSLIKLANRMYKEGDPVSKLTKAIEFMSDGINEFFVPPTIAGERIGGGGIPNADLPNGLDPTAFTFKDIVEWAVANIKDDLGLNNVRTAYNPKPNDGLGLQMQTTESSINATRYIPMMVDSLIRNGAKHCLLTKQDIVRFKDTLPYNYILSVHGESVVSRLQGLNNIAHHRYNLVLNSLGSYNNRKKIHQDTEIAFERQQITYAVKLMVDSIDDPKKAAQVLMFEQEKEAKRKQEEVRATQEHLERLEQMKGQLQIQRVQIEGQLELQREDLKGQWLYRVEQLKQESEASIKREIMANEPDKQEARASGKIKEIAAKSSIEKQAPLR